MRNPAPRIGFIAPLSAMANRVRLAKMATVLTQAGYELDFAGWERLPGQADEKRWPDSAVKETVLMRGGGYAGRMTRLLYPLWMARVFLHVLLGKRPKILFCLGFETAFPALLASCLRPATIIFDDADRFSLIVRMPDPFHRLLVALERWTSRRARFHLVPGFSRYEWRHDGMIALSNTPSSADFQWARQNGTPRPEADLVLYVNGWVSRERGAATLLDAVDRFLAAGHSIKILAAGHATDEAGRALFAHHATIFHGKLPQRESLALYGAADVTFTYYDPVVPVNRRAEANKWGDCIFFGCPFIVNSEVETARPFRERGAAFAVPFANPAALASLFAELANNPAMLQRAAEAARSFRHDYPPYDLQLTRFMERLTDRRSVHRKGDL